MPGTRRRIEVSRVANAPARKVFAFLTRPDNHRALDTSGMIRSSADHHRVTETGAVFVMNMHNEIKGDHQVENHVICYEPDRAIGWAPAEPGADPAGHTWIWRLTQRDQTRPWSPRSMTGHHSAMSTCSITCLSSTDPKCRPP